MLLIKNGRVLTMAGAVYERGWVLIDQGKIAAVGEGADGPKADRALDAEGGWIMPGLMEAHCHIGITEQKMGMEGDDCNEVTEPITPQLRALDAVNPMDSAFHNALAAGITAVMVGPGSANVVGGQFMVIKTHGRCIDQMVVKAPAALKVAFGENPKGNYGGKDKMPATRMAIAAMLRGELDKARRYAQTRRRDPSAAPDPMLEPYLPVLSGQIPLKVHAHRTDDILTAIRIAKEFHIGLTLDHCTEGHLIADAVKASGFPAIVGPNLASRSKIEVRNMDFKTAGVLHQAGVTVAITTDHPVSIIQYLPLCAGLAAREGLGVEAALAAITCNPARICRVDDRLGTLEPGKDADVAIFDGNPLEVFTHAQYTLVNGEVVFPHLERPMD